MIIPKSVRRTPPKSFGEFNEGLVDVYAEQFSEDVECMMKLEIESDDPKEIRKLIKWLDKVAVYLEHCQERQ